MRKVVDHFEIPEELARELSELLITQTIREKLLMELINSDDESKYEAVERKLAPVTAKIEAIKIKITSEYVPAKYNSPRYMWNYMGYEVSKNLVEVIEDVE